MTTVTWVQDSEGRFEVSSAEHLKQLMHQGTLYTNAGTSPTTWWGASGNFVSYIQTADIDLLSDSTDIKPIGIFGDNFYGNYDGGEYTISNYSYVDPNFSTSSGCQIYVGLFGWFFGAYLKNIRLSGVWTIQGFNWRAGFVAGHYWNETGSISNIEANFSTGTFMDTNSAVRSSGVDVGSIFGSVDATYATSITVRGTVDFQQDPQSTGYAGGIAGQLSLHSGDATLIRNIASFPSGISGTLYAGGLFGYVANNDFACSLTKVLNAMVGDVFCNNPTGTAYAGGVIGFYDQVSSTNYEAILNNVVNSMTGDVYTTSNDPRIGGVVGGLQCRQSCEKILNYMTGNVYNLSPATTDTIGGVCGELTLESVGALSNVINAMNGSVDGDGLFGTSSSTSLTPTNTITDTSFGLTFGSDAFNTGAPTGLLTNSEFTDLPYFDLTGTDVDGNPYDFEFVYGNLSGNPSYADYTHLVLHRTDIVTPYDVTYGLTTGNTTVYLTYVNVQTMTVYAPVGLTGTTPAIGVGVSNPPLPPLSASTRSINIFVVIAEVSGAVGYNVSIEGPTGGETTVLSGVTTLEHNLTGLAPETAYTIRLYVDTGSGYEVTEELTTTTLANVAASYDITDFQDDNGATDLTTLDTTTLSNIAQVVTELVSTGDVVSVSVANSSESSVINTTFVDSGESIGMAGVDGILLPFDQASGSGQEVTLTLSDGSSTPVVYDEAANTISVDSVSYGTGDALYLDGSKLEVFDFFGLTVVSVGVAPIVVDPRAINIPVTITEVTGAIGYKIAYVGPDGSEVTKLTGVTALDQNITGLVADTEYTIKLYADTGSGYVLTEELPTRTLTNVASNYDVTDLVQDGVIQLGSLPDATLSSIAQVMNELFDTGDAVSVSVRGRSDLNTSFIKLGETLSIQELSGVLLPFTESGAAGQDVSVVLSDGATTVGIDYDETADSITVNGVVYHPGDTFVLDGKKVTVVGY